LVSLVSQYTAILSAIQCGAHFTHDIAERIGVARHIVQIRIAELVKVGQLSAYRIRHISQCRHHRTKREKFYRLREH
jgi:hypothetical protein